MYLVNEHIQHVDHETLVQFQHTHHIQLPEAYCEFLEKYGVGTYCGVLNIQLPDEQQLTEFVEYELWENDEDSPITNQQLAECVVIGTTIDGDFLALHPQVNDLLWIPRHSERMEVRPLDDKASWIEMMDQWLKISYGDSFQILQENRYYESWNQDQRYRSLTFHPPIEGNDLVSISSSAEQLTQIAHEIDLQIPADLKIETAYSCLLFWRSIQGYARFNYAYGYEVVLCYEDHDKEASEQLLNVLLQHHIYEDSPE